MTQDVATIARGLTKAQREAIIECVDALDYLTGEGHCIAEDAIYNLFSAFDGDIRLDYRDWVRALLSQDTGEA